MPFPPGVWSERAALHGCRAGLWLSVLATRLVVHHLELERFSAKARSGQALVRVFGSSVNPVNVDLVEPICEGFGCSAGTLWHRHGGRRRRSGRRLRLDVRFGGAVHRARCVRPVCLGDLQSDKPFSLSLARLARFPSLEGPAAVSAGSRRSLDLETHGRLVTAGQGGTGFIEVQLAKALGAGTVISAHQEMALIS